MRRPPPRRTTRQHDDNIIRAAEEDPFTNVVAIRERLQLDVLAMTVRRRLHEAGIHHRVEAGIYHRVEAGIHHRVLPKKESLTEQHRAGRLAFAQRYVGEDLEFWSRVVFTDEKSFSSTSHGRMLNWRPNNTR